MSSRLRKYGPWAVVTGASAGIGREFARQLAAAGLNVVVVARRAARLEALAGELRAAHGVDVKVVSADLTEAGGISAVLSETAALDVGLLVNNAGAAELGPLLSSELSVLQRNVALNVGATLSLTHAFGRRLAARGRPGGILILSSMVGLLGVEHFASYAATKAYDLTLAEGLAAELRGTVDVHAVLPGFTVSEYVDSLDLSRVPMPLMQTDALVRGALRALGGRRVLVVPGRFNRLSVWAMTWAPRWLNTALFSAVVKRLSRTPPAALEARAG